MKRNIAILAAAAIILPGILSTPAAIANEKTSDTVIRESYQSETETSKTELIEAAFSETEFIETELIETEFLEIEVLETEVLETEFIEIELIETEFIETEIIETEFIETEIIETEFIETEFIETEFIQTETTETETTDIIWNETETTEQDSSSNPSVLYARKDLFCLEVSRMNGVMPSDVFLQLRSLEDISSADEYPSQAVEEYRELLLNLLYEEIIEQYLAYSAESDAAEELSPYMYEVIASSVQMFEVVELQFLYYDESSYDPGEILLNASIETASSELHHITEENSFLFPVWYDENLTLHIPTSSDSHVSVSDKEIQMSLSGMYHPTFFAVAAIDRFKIESLYDSAVQLQEKQTYTDSMEEEADSSETADIPMESVFAYIQPGTPCTASSSYTKVSPGSRTFSSEYTFLRGTSKSVCTMWYDSNEVLKGYQESTGMEYLMPKSSEARGKFGFRITNVGYSSSARCSLDLYVTVTKFKTYSLDQSGNRVKGVYPLIHMNNNLTVYYQAGLPAFELQCDIVKSGTTEKIAGNYRFMWTDIDGAQRYGFLPVNGKLDAKYCLNTSTVACGTETQFSLNYQMLYGQAETSTAKDENCSVMYETSSISSFKIYVGQNGDGTAAYRYTEDTILDRYQDAADGVYNHTARAKLGWNGSAYGPTSLPSPLTKSVSNDAETWSHSNVLPSVSSEYWYELEIFIPQETSEYYYSEYQIKDVLPKGADYVGDFSVQKIETGTAVNSFSAVETDDTVIISAKSSALDSSSFYGFTYRIRFKVKMDPTEIQPSYTGTSAVYTVTNQAVQTGRHKSDLSLTSTSSNTVSTTASEKRQTVHAPVKWIQTDDGLMKESELDSRNDSFVYEIQQELPEVMNAWKLDTLEITDQLEACLEVKEITVYQNNSLCGQWTPQESGTIKKGWICNISGQNIQILTEGQIPDSYYNDTISVTIRSGIRNDADLSAYAASEVSELRTIRIPNQAVTVCTWKKGSPAAETQKSNLVWIGLTETIRTMSRIILTKSILAEEIVWAHGNPVFTFCVEGTDVLGIPHKYYDTVEFTREHTPVSGAVIRQAVFEVPSGTYRAYETNVIRYRLSSIDSILNGSAAGVGVNFRVSSDRHGTAIFHNRKTTDEKLSDTVFVRNTIVEE